MSECEGCLILARIMERLFADRDKLIDAFITEDRGRLQTIYVWRVGQISSHEPSLELAQAAVCRAIGISWEKPT